jgi:hypothetical protein
MTTGQLCHGFLSDEVRVCRGSALDAAHGEAAAHFSAE